MSLWGGKFVCIYIIFKVYYMVSITSFIKVLLVIMKGTLSLFELYFLFGSLWLCLFLMLFELLIVFKLFFHDEKKVISGMKWFFWLLIRRDDVLFQPKGYQCIIALSHHKSPLKKLCFKLIKKKLLLLNKHESNINYINKLLEKHY